MPNFRLSPRCVRVLLPLSASAFVAGCSADVARFDMPAGFNGGNQTSSIVPPANVYGAPPRAGLLGDADGASHQPPPMASESSRGGDVRVAELPPAAGAYEPGPRTTDDGPSSYGRGAPRAAGGYEDPGYRHVAAKPYDAAPRRQKEARFETAAYAKPTGGETIEVKPGDTLYGLSRQHGVPVSEIMSANDLRGHSLKPGQRLTLPSGHAGRAIAAPTTIPDAAPAPVDVGTSTASATPTADAPGTYTMKAGDSLYAIARQHKVKYADLQRHNGITDADVRKIRPGTVLKIPGGSEAPALASAAPATAAPTPSETVTAAPAVSEPAKVETSTPASSAPAAEAPKVLNAAPAVSGVEPVAAPAEPDKKVAALDPATRTDAAPAAKSSNEKGGRLRWPVQGRVISAFGPRPDGTHNDGVNLSVPLGTDVHAAENGEVIYVGDELKAYGKLVLLRHDNGWVTAYAHNDELLVTRGKKVVRGDIIAKAGKTGPVDQPQVHFELRQDSKAVDPTSFMETN